MKTTTTNNNSLPLFQSIRSPRLQEADDLTQRFLRTRRIKMMALLVFVFIAVFSFHGETIMTIIKPIPAITFPSEPNTFTPRIVMHAMEETQRQNDQPWVNSYFFNQRNRARVWNFRLRHATTVKVIAMFWTEESQRRSTLNATSKAPAKRFERWFEEFQKAFIQLLDYLQRIELGILISMNPISAPKTAYTLRGIARYAWTFLGIIFLQKRGEDKMILEILKRRIRILRS